MTLPKQRPQEDDKDFALRLEKAKKAAKKKSLEYYKANREAMKEKNRKYYEANKEVTKERQHKYREANKEATRERKHKYREANKEAIKERDRKYYEANREKLRKFREVKVLENAKGKPLQSNYTKAKRPVMLTRLIIEEAKAFCLEWGFTTDQVFDTDVLRNAARAIRDNPFYPVVVPPEELETFLKENRIMEPTNPWYRTDYLHESTLNNPNWGASIRILWQKKQ